MTLEGVLFAMNALTLIPLWIVVFILTRGAIKRPRVRALSAMAILTGLIATALTAYVIAVVNAGANYAVPKEVGQVILRAALLGVQLFPLWFLWLYRTGRFRDGDEL